jgi:hypothetical protein
MRFLRKRKEKNHEKDRIRSRPGADVGRHLPWRHGFRGRLLLVGGMLRFGRRMLPAGVVAGSAMPLAGPM